MNTVTNSGRFASPAATVALRTLDALGVTTVDQAREILALWCRPSPPLAPADVRHILGEIAAQAQAAAPDVEPVERTASGSIVVRDERGQIIGYAIDGSADA